MALIILGLTGLAAIAVLVALVLVAVAVGVGIMLLLVNTRYNTITSSCTLIKSFPIFRGAVCYRYSYGSIATANNVSKIKLKKRSNARRLSSYDQFARKNHFNEKKLAA